MNGVIESIMVAANESLSKGQVMVELDKTHLQNQVDVAEQVLKFAESKFATTQQLSFTDPDKKALLTPRLQVEQQRAELAYSHQLLRRATVTAEQ